MGVVLLRPKSPGNVGSVARAMKNMGFSRLVLADPIEYRDPGHFDDEARRMAWNAADVLESRTIVPDLKTALAPFHLVVGTTSNPPSGAREVDPRGAADEIAALLEAGDERRAALLFGQEDIGLTREHLSRCHVVGTIPSAEAYPSLNLSQAALLFLYELRTKLISRKASPAASTDDADRPPSHEELEAFYGRLARMLGEIGFLQGTSREHMMRELRSFFNRSLLTARELAVFEGICRQALWAARRSG